MAKILLPVMVAAAFLAGCQTKGPAAFSPPNLDGPKILAHAPDPVPADSPQGRSGSVSRGPQSPPVPREWIPAVPPNNWQWIVIHHSATPAGSARAFDASHRHRGWDELGYHFVIGNGTGSGDGQIEVGSRWPKQKWGAHAKTPDNRFNEYGIGICLVGDFSMDRPTPAQIESLTRLVGYLMFTYQIAPSHVLGHGQTKPTECPGRYVNVAEIRRRASALASRQTTMPPDPAQARAQEKNGALAVWR
jgi:hypothetical protein